MSKSMFKSARLGFRNRNENDKPTMGVLNSDLKVMEPFPSILSQKQTDGFIDRMKMQFSKDGFCYFTVNKPDGNKLSDQIVAITFKIFLIFSTISIYFKIFRF